MNDMNAKMHYGWYIVIVCMLMVFGASLVSTGMTVYITELKNQGVSPTETSFIITISSITAFIATYIADRYFRRFGLKNGMLIAVISGMVAFIIYSVAGTTIWLYYTGAVFGGVTYGLGFMMSSSMLIRRWFNRNRGLALSICSAGSGISIAVGTPILQTLITEFGLQASFISEAAFMAVVVILILLFVRNDPSEMNLEPVGGMIAEVESEKQRFKLSRPVLIMLIVAAILCGTAGFPATSNLHSNFTDCCIDPMLVAFGISVFGIILLISKLIFGRVVDKKGALFSTILFGIFIAVGLIGCYLIQFFPDEAFMFATFILLGIGYPITTLGFPNWTAEFTTRDEYPDILKYLQIGFQFGIVIGSPIPGPMTELTGSLSNAYLIFAIFIFLSLLLVSSAYGIAKRS